jgi:hypothetical protein
MLAQEIRAPILYRVKPQAFLNINLTDTAALGRQQCLMAIVVKFISISTRLPGPLTKATMTAQSYIIIKSTLLSLRVTRLK